MTIDTSYQPGHPSPRLMHHHSLQYLGLPPVDKIEVGLQHGMALTKSGAVYGWGKGDRGRLLDSLDVSDKTVHPVPLQIKHEVVDISLGFNHSAVLTAKGKVFVWGKGMSNVIKSSSIASICQDQVTPRNLALPGNRRVVEICSSNFSLVARCEDGTVWAMGMGEHDRLVIPEFLPVFGLDVDDQLVIDDSYFLRKGLHRVSLARSNGNMYQILLHNREAYVKNDFDNIKQVSAAVRERNEDRLLDVSFGWKHELLIVQRNSY